MAGRISPYSGLTLEPLDIIASFLLLPQLSRAAEVPSGGLRIVSPADGTTVEPGQAFTVIVEPERGITTPTHIGLVSPNIVALKEQPPFTFLVNFPVDAPLGPETVFANGRDTRERALRTQVTLQIETSTPVTSVRVNSPPLRITTQRRISVFGTFTDGVEREITRSREISYVSSNPKVATVTSDGLVETVDTGSATITVTYKGQSFSFPVKVEFKKISVPIDIKPEDPRNVVNLSSKGRLPVAIFSTTDFDASMVRPDTVRFGPKGARPVIGKEGDRGDRDEEDDRDDKGERRRPVSMLNQHLEDINGDRLPDLLLFFRVQEIGLTCADTQATLTGFTLRGERISGSDAVQPIGPGCR